MMYRTPSYAQGVYDCFFFDKNLQGDIVAVYNASGTKVVSYTYDAWGNVTTTYHSGGASTGARYNPFRYRGYYYDAETEWYYLQSRYYNPSWGRFINPDQIDVLTATPDQLTDKNLLAYCDNNPVMRSDADGEFWATLGIMAVGGVISGIVSAVTSAITQQVTTGDINWASVGVAAASGFVSGAIAASPLGVVGQAIIGGGIEVASYVADSYVTGEETTIGGVVFSALWGGFVGWRGGNGANYKLTLTNTIKNAKDTVVRESRRANREYAAKAVTNALAYRNNRLSYEAVMFSTSSIVSTIVSTIKTNLVYSIKTDLTNLFNKWKEVDLHGC